VSESAHRFALIAEDSANAHTSSTLVDRAIGEDCSVEWLRQLWEEPSRTTTRAWTPIDGDTGERFEHGSYSKLTNLPKLVPRVHALRVAGGGKAVEIAKAIAAIEWTSTCDHAAAAVIAYDADDDPKDELRICQEFESRRARFEEAHPGCVLLLALARPEAEAWYIAALALGQVDGEELAALRRELGFDPLQHPERLRSTSDDSPRDAKRVCRRLVAGRARGEVGECVASIPLGEWTTRGAGCGVEALERAVIDRLIPALQGRTRSR